MIARRAGFQFLNERINENYQITRRLKHNLYFQRRELHYAMRPNHAEQLEEVRLHSEEQERKKVKDRQKKKFDKLLQRDRRRASVVS